MIIFDKQYIKNNNITFVIKKNIVEIKKMIYSTLEKNILNTCKI